MGVKITTLRRPGKGRRYPLEELPNQWRKWQQHREGHVSGQLGWPLALRSRPCDFSGFFLISVFFFYKSSFALKYSCTKRSSHHGKKEVACIVSKPVVPCWGCEESCKSSKIERPGGSGGFVLPATHFSGFFTFVKTHPWFWLFLEYAAKMSKDILACVKLYFVFEYFIMSTSNSREKCT